MEPRHLATTLSAPATFRLGEPILVALQIENADEEGFQMLSWGTPLEGRLTADCFTVLRDGEAVPYDGVLVKRGDPTSDAYVVVPPGERVTETVDLSTAYPIDRPGHYTATLNASLSDAFPTPGAAKSAPRKRQAHVPLRLEPAIVEFEVVAGDEPKATAGQTVRKATAKLAKSDAKAPSFNGGTATDQADAIVAHGNAQRYAALAASQLELGPASTNALYQTWFGAFDQTRYDSVKKHYNDISNVLLNEAVTYDFSGSSPAGDTCDASTFAFTYPGSRTVWLCALYQSAAQIGRDCKFGTMVHEWSHAVSGTADNAYGETACQTLATTDTGKATNNADSHEYFAEHNAQSDFGKSFTFITDRSSFGKDEIDAMLSQATPALIEKAFYVVADGYTPDGLGVVAASLGASPNIKPALTVTPSIPGMTVSVASLEAEDPSLPIAPQRFTWVCRIAFASDAGFPAAGATTAVTLTATLNTLSSNAQIQLFREPNPFELDGETSWLSTDLRVFQVREGEGRFGAGIGSAPGAASTFIKQALANLNSGNAGGQSFDGLSTDPQTSVLELSNKVHEGIFDFNGTKVYNFAIAKVRFRGTSDVPNVRVFFRLFPAATTSTAFDANGTYRRATSGTTAIAVPGLSGGGDLLTIPCFAENRVDSGSVSVATQADPANVRTLVHDAGGGETAAYFGCWLDINQTEARIPLKPSGDGPWPSDRRSIQELMRNAHQCLVAEIAFDPRPIPAGASPAQSDKLAQRNLVVVQSANPGHEASRTILSTFDLRPAVGGPSTPTGPDELMIEWGNVPPGSVARIYIPEIDVAQIVALADARLPSHRFARIDGQTIEMPTGGISYVPLPPGVAFGLTGLLSFELPDTVVKGEVYTIVVRQVADAGARRIPAPDGVGANPALAGGIVLARWRRIVGSYQITIPVRTRDAMLPAETRLLSTLRWILKSVPKGDRWYPAFSRYVGMVGERVGALGGDPSLVEASPEGTGRAPGREPGGAPDGGSQRDPRPGDERTRSHDGKVAGLVYDCFGDFEGFILDDCGEETAFYAREHRIEALARLAWRERIAVTVIATVASPHRPQTIVLRRAPEPFQA